MSTTYEPRHRAETQRHHGSAFVGPAYLVLIDEMGNTASEKVPGDAWMEWDNGIVIRFSDHAVRRVVKLRASGRFDYMAIYSGGALLVKKPLSGTRGATAEITL